jgi:hypothetical protein
MKLKKENDMKFKVKSFDITVKENIKLNERERRELDEVEVQKGYFNGGIYYRINGRLTEYEPELNIIKAELDKAFVTVDYDDVLMQELAASGIEY